MYALLRARAVRHAARMTSETDFEVVIVGGGPTGLSAALMLGRGCRKVLLCDAGPRRNSAAEGIHNFVTRDGTPPQEFRAIARQQFAPYDVQIRDEQVTTIQGELDRFTLSLSSGQTVQARRILLALGMVDQMLDLPGFARLWGRSIFICPYCHGWEVRGLRWGVLVQQPMMAMFARLLRTWNPSVQVFTGGTFSPAEQERAQLEGFPLDERPIRALLGQKRLEAVEMDDGSQVPLDVLFAHPPQQQTPLVAGLGLDLDEQGYLRVDAMGQTSRSGIHAAGDLTTRMQSAIGGAAAGAMAAGAIQHLLVLGPEAHWGPKR